MGVDDKRGVDTTEAAVPLADTLSSAGGVPPPSPVSTPTTIGRFEILSKLGAGGMGVVMLATDPLLGRRVAIKIVRGERSGPSDAAKRRLLREAQAMAQLSHENVIVVHEVGEHEGQVYVAMEYVVGTTLTRWQAAKRSWREIVDMYLRAGRGLQAAHDAGLVHRDFKPDNVLVGDDSRLRVTDFGLVASGDMPVLHISVGAISELDMPLTQTGALMGTPRYMAPEQHRGEEVDARADQFAFCVALYEALFGAAPFEGSSYDELARSVLAGELRPMPETAAVPPAIRAVLRRGLSRDRDARFSTMRELLAELAPPLAAPRSRRWLLAAVAAGVAASAAAVIAVRLLRPEPDPAPPPATAPPATAPPAERRAADDDRMRRTWQGFTEGAGAFLAHDYEAAARAFGESYEIDHQPVFLYDQAASLYMTSKTSKDVAAVAAATVLFERYLAEEPQAFDRDQIEALLAALHAGAGALPAELAVHGFVVIESAPSGGTVYVDAKKTAFGVTPWTGWLPGKHHVRVEKPGYGKLETDAVIDGAKLTNLSLSFVKEPAP